MSQGQFGIVLKGVLGVKGGLAQEEVAIKRLHVGSGFDRARSEFKKEIALTRVSSRQNA